MLSGVAGGFVMAAFLTLLVKRTVGEVRGVLAMEISDPEVRRSLVTPFSLQATVLSCVVGISVLSLAFAMVLFATKRMEPVEELTIRWQQSVLEALTGRLERQQIDAAIRSVLGENAGLAVPIEVVLLDPADPGSKRMSSSTGCPL